MLPILTASLLAWFSIATPAELASDRILTVQTTATEAASPDEDRALAHISQLLAAGNEQGADGDFAASVESYKQAIALVETLASPPLLLKGEALYGLGRAYGYQAEYDRALPALKAALMLYQGLADDQTPADRAALAYADIQIDLLLILGSIYQEKANFGTALTYYRPGLAIAQAAERIEEQAIFQHNIGALEAEIGQYDLAKNALVNAVELSEQLSYPDLEASTVFTLGWVAERQQNYDEAIAHYQAALTLFDSIQAKDHSLRASRVLNNLGMVHLKQGNYAAASKTFDQGFALLAVQDDPIERAVLLNSTGSLNEAKGDAAKAWTVYLQALQLSAQTDDTIGEIEVLLNLGRLMETQQKPDVAIFFYKQAIAKIEAIRQDLQQLSKSVQQRYTLTIEDFYRNLADLLLQQNRAAEALEILDLLKLQEVSAYLNSNAAQNTASDLNNASETTLADLLETLPAETALADFLAHPAATALTASALTSSRQDTPFDLKAIESLKAALFTQPVKTAVLYPLILEDRLEILLITPEGTVKSASTAVSQSALEKSVNDLQKSLKSKAFDAKPPAQQLYDWLIRPLENVLRAHQIENIIYLPDGVLRYVPLAAFHDGQQWLVQSYQSHNITAAALDDLTASNESGLSVMAGAFTNPEVSHPVTVGADSFTFSGLSAAKKEVENLSAVMPGTVALLDAEFTPEETLAAVGDRNILHLATHAKFVPGQPEDSFILFGDGEAVNMRSLREWQLPNVELVVLSACQTANSIEGEGKEILGLGFQIRKTGAKAAIASLWAVDDNATAALMTQFYQALSIGKTKAQALHDAQIKLIESDGFSDPYDWGAFILIGNGS